MHTRNSSLPQSQETNGSIDDSLGAMQDERGRNQQPGGSNDNSTAAEADTNNQTPESIPTESRKRKKASNAVIQMRALSKSRIPGRGGNAKGEFHQTYCSWYNRYKSFVTTEADNRDELATFFNNGAVICIPGVNAFYVEKVSKMKGQKEYIGSALTALKHRNPVLLNEQGM